MKFIAFIACLAGLVLLVSTTPAFGATLWDFVISAKFEQEKIDIHDRPVIFGTVLNHAMKPVPDAEVQIRFASTSVTTTTNSTGHFTYEFEEQGASGTFAVNIYVTSGDKKGLLKTTLTVGNDQTTFNDLYYKSKLPNDRNNPYTGLQLKHYQQYIEEQEKRRQVYLDIESKNLALEIKRQIAQQKLEEAVEYYQPGHGTYSADKQDRYISSINPALQDAIASQLNYTKNVFDDARKAMKAVLDSGGSLQEAQDVYFEKITIKKEHLESFGVNATEPNKSTIKAKEPKSSKKVEGLTIKGRQ